MSQLPIAGLYLTETGLDNSKVQAILSSIPCPPSMDDIVRLLLKRGEETTIYRIPGIGDCVWNANHRLLALYSAGVRQLPAQIRVHHPDSFAYDVCWMNSQRFYEKFQVRTLRDYAERCLDPQVSIRQILQ